MQLEAQASSCKQTSHLGLHCAGRGDCPPCRMGSAVTRPNTAIASPYTHKTVQAVGPFRLRPSVDSAQTTPSTLTNRWGGVVSPPRSKGSESLPNAVSRALASSSAGEGEGRKRFALHDVNARFREGVS